MNCDSHTYSWAFLVQSVYTNRLAASYASGAGSGASAASTAIIDACAGWIAARGAQAFHTSIEPSAEPVAIQPAHASMHERCVSLQANKQANHGRQRTTWHPC